jgi:hypothetical protein
MNKTYILGLLFMLVFTGFSLLGNTYALASLDPCTQAEAQLGTCLQIPKDSPVYIVRAVKSDGVSVVPSDLGVDWPFIENDRTVFRYKGGLSTATTDNKPSAWSYIVFSLSDLPLGAVPPGAQLSLDKLNSGCSATLDPSRIAYKLNPSVNFKSDAVFEIQAPLGTGIDCNGFAWVLWGKECAGGRLLTPGSASISALSEPERTFKCGEGQTVTVKYNICGDVEEVKYNNNIVLPTPYPYGYAEAVPTDEPQFPDYPTVRIFPITNMGPGTPGVTVCTDSDPVFLRGNQAWWCGEPLP